MVHRFDRVLIMDEGHVVADLPPTDVQAAIDRGDLDALSQPGRELMAQLAKAATAATRDEGTVVVWLCVSCVCLHADVVNARMGEHEHGNGGA